MTSKTWEFKGYTVFEETDLLRFENLDGDIIGYVAKDERVVEDLDNDDASPIEDRWEDGVGNNLEITGWGEEEPKDIRTMYDRLRGILNVDGEDERYMTIFEDEEGLREAKGIESDDDLKKFENEFGVEVSELNYPVVVLDRPSAAGGYVFNRDEMHDLKDEALEYFTKK